ncbi:bifunctional serine/threonine-protein kinase/formylglycine-generating enzyme family protein [Tundrisphaera lichenicola]|uniref:bifunctional serine/threonine-protein kinase/formylglycine-generating enzyme family protein n=1 Tax=Tundrisphaera lichenicola TaxID=2029860 RepID=UPI003EBBC873
MTSQSQKTPPEIPGYEILRLIGLGGMGEVYLARQLALNRPVAIKFLSRPETEFPDEYNIRFRREAELMARVTHPNIVTIFDFGYAGGRPYLVMEYIETGDLRSRMIPDVPMPIAEVRAIIAPVIWALEYLHREGIIHRDMKPENILIHHENTPKVSDFGLAVIDFAIGSLTRTGRMMGTPGYVSPEQQYGLKIDERADQFSMAAMCYEIVTGRKPLGHYPPPSRLNPRLSQAADAAIRKGLSDDPEDRFETIRAFGEALEQGLAETPSRTRPDRRLAWIAGAIVLSSLLATFLYYWRSPAPVVPDIPPTSGNLPIRIVTRHLKMGLVLIPRGEFWMGSPDSDPSADPEEKPSHQVRISRPFYMGEKEVTVGQFRVFVHENQHLTSAEKTGRGGFTYIPELGRLEQRQEFTWEHPGLGPRPADDQPVVQVSASDAMAFCEWLSRVEGRPYRLPTEAEWEYACRAGSETRWSTGDDPRSLEPFAWTLENSGGVLHAVGTKRPNKFGLFDMHGNAWEWCSDWQAGYKAAPIGDPIGDPSTGLHAVRGGSIDWDDVDQTRSASRHPHPSTDAFFTFGFRVCSPVKP